MPLRGTRRHRPSLRDARVRVRFHEGSVTALSRQDQNLQRRSWSLLTSVRTRHGVTHVLPKRKRPNRQSRLSPMCIGRDDWIRTSDPLTPSQVRYQAAPHPDSNDHKATALRPRLTAPSRRSLALGRVLGLGFSGPHLHCCQGLGRPRRLRCRGRLLRRLIVWRK